MTPTPTHSIRACPSPNHGPRPPGAVIDTLLVHYTGLPTAAIALARLCDPAAEVSAHYTIDEDGILYHHVAEERRAWHAGRGFWRGDTDLNNRSIGVELVNPGHEFGYRPFPAVQMARFTALARDIIARHHILPENVLGHADFAPARKEDPGEWFDWAGLAAAGIGLWPAALPAASSLSAVTATPPEAPRLAQVLAAALVRYGYDPALPLAQTLTAFQRHFYPEAVRAGRAGEPDGESLRRLNDLLRQTGR